MSQEKTPKSPWKIANKGIVWVRNGIAFIGSAYIGAKVLLPSILKDVFKK